MKRFIFVSVVLVLISVNATAQNRTYVDLGLTSGTKWCSKNESGYWSYSNARNSFGSSLPTMEQFSELIAECEWTWTGSGYRVKGSNGNAIYLPADGFDTDKKGRCGYSGGKGESGNYWSYSPIEGPNDDRYSWGLFFSRGFYKTDKLCVMTRDQTCGSVYSLYSVRLVQ